MPPASSTSTRARPTALLILAALFLAARLATGLHEAYNPPRLGGLVHWTSPEEAESLAATQHKPLLYDFSATWCEPCKQMDREVFSDPASSDYINQTFVAVRIPDEDRSPSASAARQHHQVDALPTLVVLPRDSKDPRRMEGYPGRRKLVGFLNASAAAKAPR
jgi:thiol:disulfide interchange protein